MGFCLSARQARLQAEKPALTMELPGHLFYHTCCILNRQNQAINVCTGLFLLFPALTGSHLSYTCEKNWKILNSNINKASSLIGLGSNDVKLVGDRLRDRKEC